MVYTAGLNRLQKKIFLPGNFSLLASVGLHGVLLGVVLPKWHVEAQPKRDSTLTNTPVIELNEFEQTRLPNLSWSKGNLLTQLPPPNTQIPHFSTPPIDNSTISNFTLHPSLTPFSNYSPNIPTSDTLPPPPPPRAITPQAIATILPDIENKLANIQSSEQEELNLKTRASLFPSLENYEPIDPRELINLNHSPNQPNQETPMAVNPPNSTRNESESGNNQVTLSSPPATPPPYLGLTSMLQADTSNTTNEEARKNYVAWLEEVRDVKPEQVTLIGVYPQDACIRKLEGSAAYGVTVNPQGKVTDSQLIKSAGYPLFNQQGLKQIQARSFANTTSNPKAFHVYVNFSYNPDICPSLTLSRVKAPPVKPPSNLNFPSSSEPNSKPEQHQEQSTPATTNSSPKSPVETEEVKPSLTPPTAETQSQQSPKSPTATTSPPTVTETEVNPNPQKQPENSEPVKSKVETPSPSANQLSQPTPIPPTPEPPPTEEESPATIKQQTQPNTNKRSQVNSLQMGN